MKAQRIFQEEKIKFEEGNNYHINPESEVKVIITDKRIVVKNSWKKPRSLIGYKRLPGNKYQDGKTGDIKEYKKEYYKSEKAIKNNMRKLKQLINLNFHKYDNMYFITLTSEENIEDIELIRKYTRQFIRKLKLKYKRYNFMYVYKFERQERRSWHTHILIKDIQNKKLFLMYDEIKELWKNGIIYLEKVDQGKINVDYKDKDDNENNHPTEKISNYMCKITQLYDVPNGQHIYGRSTNIRKPKILKMKQYQAEEKIKNDGALFESERTILIRSTKTNRIINKHKTEVYKR